jgi:hypothetical protein
MDDLQVKPEGLSICSSYWTCRYSFTSAMAATSLVSCSPIPMSARKFFFFFCITSIPLSHFDDKGFGRDGENLSLAALYTHPPLHLRLAQLRGEL